MKKLEKIVETDEIGSATGALHSKGGEHVFSADNACPYFLAKTELCFLDGRICLYDTETFPVCRRYKEGMGRRIPGPDGQIPNVPAVNSMTDITGDTDTGDLDDKKLYKS